MAFWKFPESSSPVGWKYDCCCERRYFQPSHAKWKKVLLRITGPPTAAPYWFWRNGVGPSRPASRKGLRESNASLRRNSQTAPWKSLVPDLETRLITPPRTPPYSALSLWDCTLNSCTASTIGSTAQLWPKNQWLITPSSRFMLLRFQAPLIEGSAKDDPGRATGALKLVPPALPWAVLTGVAPGVSVSSCE